MAETYIIEEKEIIETDRPYSEEEFTNNLTYFLTDNSANSLFYLKPSITSFSPDDPEINIFPIVLTREEFLNTIAPLDISGMVQDLTSYLSYDEFIYEKKEFERELISMSSNRQYNILFEQGYLEVLIEEEQIP